MCCSTVTQRDEIEGAAEGESRGVPNGEPAGDTGFMRPRFSALDHPGAQVTAVTS